VVPVVEHLLNALLAKYHKILSYINENILEQLMK
jgi:hypothetical protein